MLHNLEIQLVVEFQSYGFRTLSLPGNTETRKNPAQPTRHRRQVLKFEFKKNKKPWWCSLFRESKSIGNFNNRDKL